MYNAYYVSVVQSAQDAVAPPATNANELEELQLAIALSLSEEHGVAAMRLPADDPNAVAVPLPRSPTCSLNAEAALLTAQGDPQLVEPAFVVEMGCATLAASPEGTRLLLDYTSLGPIATAGAHNSTAPEPVTNQLSSEEGCRFDPDSEAAGSRSPFVTGVNDAATDQIAADPMSTQTCRIAGTVTRHQDESNCNISVTKQTWTESSENLDLVTLDQGHAVYGSSPPRLAGAFCTDQQGDKPNKEVSGEGFIMDESTCKTQNPESVPIVEDNQPPSTPVPQLAPTVELLVSEPVTGKKAGASCEHDPLVQSQRDAGEVNNPVEPPLLPYEEERSQQEKAWATAEDLAVCSAPESHGINTADRKPAGPATDAPRPSVASHNMRPGPLESLHQSELPDSNVTSGAAEAAGETTSEGLYLCSQPLIMLESSDSDRAETRMDMDGSFSQA